MNAPTQTDNPFAVAAAQRPAALDATVSRAAQEIQAAMVIARKFPRDQIAAYDKIMLACRRKGLAEEAAYAYRKGGTLATGPTIRLLEVILQNWGNSQSGIVELERRTGESTVMSFAWDLETNYYDSKTFSVPHQIELKSGAKKIITDDREIYEHVANYGARRKRACMEAVVPRDVIDDALAECEKTLRGAGNSEPIIDRLRKMIGSFSEFGVTQAMIEKRLGHKLDATIEQEVILLGKIFKSIRDGMGKREDYFDFETSAKTEAGQSLETVIEDREKERAAENDFKMTKGPPPGDGINIGGAGMKKRDIPPAEAMQEFLDAEGFVYSEFIAAADEGGWIENATSYPTLESIPTKRLAALLKSKAGMITGIDKFAQLTPEGRERRQKAKGVAT
jgi:hypothetical protein